MVGGLLRQDTIMVAVDSLVALGFESLKRLCRSACPCRPQRKLQPLQAAPAQRGSCHAGEQTLRSHLRGVGMGPGRELLCRDHLGMLCDACDRRLTRRIRGACTIVVRVCLGKLLLQMCMVQQFTSMSLHQHSSTDRLMVEISAC